MVRLSHQLKCSKCKQMGQGLVLSIHSKVSLVEWVEVQLIAMWTFK